MVTRGCELGYFLQCKVALIAKLGSFEDPLEKVKMMKSVPETKLILVTYILCMIIGISGNLITMVTMATVEKKHKCVTNIFLISLAVG